MRVVEGACCVKLGSLFSGIGGFEYSASRHGATPVWASEIDTACVSITRRHFPHMRHYGDVALMNGADIEPVDIITFGSPCQDLSIAGNRAGLTGERSGLFAEAIRIIDEMRAVTHGEYPAWAVWENVPGALSSNNRMDFRAVLEAFAGTKIPMPRSGRWAAAGMVRGGRADIAWRILDAQFWGVPQRRRRIFLVADFGGRRAGEVLFEREGMCRDTAPGGEAQEECAADIEGCAGAAGFNGWRSVTGTLEYEEDRAPCIQANMPPNVVCPKVTGTICASGAGTNRPAGQCNETDLVIVCRTDQTGSNGLGISEDVAYTLDGATGQAVARIKGIAREVSYTLDTKQPHAVNTDYVVRRLTPVECERLQGFPDGWTAYGHDGKPMSDTRRYKAIGNSVAIPCVDYIMAGIAKKE